MSGDIDIDCAAAIASRLAPTGVVVVRKICRQYRSNVCGLARDGVVSGDIDVDCAAVFASKPAPTG